MLDIPIKFRGKEIVTNSFVYGFYGEEHGRAIIADNDAVYTVDADSVSQLIGYDKGKEVYDGDGD